MDSRNPEAFKGSLNNTKYNFCSINICGMSARSQLCLDKYCYDKGIDILAVQESFTSDSSNKSLTSMIFTDDQNESRNRGSLLYVNSKKLSILPLKEISKASNNIDTAWGLISGPGIRLVVGSVYLKLGYSNSISELISMLKKATLISRQLGASGVSVFGDFNARHELWGDTTSNSYGTELVNQLDFQAYTIVAADKPSFLSVNGNSCIDFHISSVSNADAFSLLTTDEDVELFSGAPIRGHVPIQTSLSASFVKKANPPPKECLDLSTMDWGSWTAVLESSLSEEEASWENLDTEGKWQLLNQCIKNATKGCCKTKTLSAHSKPFWTPQLTESAKILRGAKRAYSKRNTLSNKEALDSAKEEFDELRKRECQNFILQRTQNLNVAQAKQFWKSFNQLFARKNQNNVESLKDDNGNLLTEPEKIEESLFSSFFACKHLEAKGQSFDNFFYEKVNDLYDEIVAGCSKTSFDADLSGEITINEAIYFFKNYSVSGKSFDNLEFHPSMFKHFGPCALQKIVDLFNCCLDSGTWVWDTADVIFLKKGGQRDFSKAGSYRPISITSYIGKVFEQIIATRLEKYLIDIGHHDEFQEGFTKKRNTARYLNRLDTDIRHSLEKKYTVICLFIDFEKAFDSVWKKGLMRKLYDAGVVGGIWKLINSFLFSRKVRLVFNNFTGIIRACREFGLPQGSALSPILFKFYVHDFASISGQRKGVSLFKFADDGTIKIAGESTSSCLGILEDVCMDIHKWSTKWRMIINCEPEKTELICFGTAEKDESLIPSSFQIGENCIKFVDKTKVLGLVMDKNLQYIDHGREICKKVLHRWVCICKYTNRNWGFRQHVIVRLLEVLIGTCICYAGIVWLNRKSMSEIEGLWYKVLKSAIGAVFNVSQNTAEVLLGVLPLEIQNRVNTIKHLLKINILPSVKDPLKELISEQLDQSTSSSITCKIKEAFNFLKWKLNRLPKHFSVEESNIVDRNQLSRFGELSTLACSYSKALIKCYGEYTWQNRLNHQYQLDGCTQVPSVSSQKIFFSIGTPRSLETLTMSLFYPNNLMLGFLNRYDPTKFPSRICPCGHAIQDSMHLLLECELINSDKRNSISQFILDDQKHPISALSDQKNLLLSWSRVPGFIQLCCSAISDVSSILLTDVTI